MITGKTLALVALLAALALHVDPSAAFEYATATRGAAAEVVAGTDAYDDMTIGACGASKLTARTCTWGNVVNQGTTDLIYKLTMTTGPGQVTQWCVGGNCASSGNAISGTINVGSTASFTATVSACLTCSSQSSLWALEGEKANILNSLHSGIPMTITWT